MQTYRLLYLRQSVLDHAEEVKANDVVEAIEHASGIEPDLRVEVWTKRSRVAVLRASPAHGPAMKAGGGRGRLR
jgi:hypothetical protein